MSAVGNTGKQEGEGELGYAPRVLTVLAGLGRERSEETEVAATQRAWVLQAIEGPRQYSGNAGYADQPTLCYHYDSFVPNHKNLRKGDFVIIRNERSVVGVALIEESLEATTNRRQFRCPSCGATGIKKRKQKMPLFRCKCGSEFDEPREEVVACTSFDARFGDTFRPTFGAPSLNRVREASTRWNGQLAMQPCRLELLWDALMQANPTIEKLLWNAQRVAATPAGLSAGDALDQSAFVPGQEDSREDVLRQIKARRGQSSFRNALIKQHGPRCQVTGCQLLHLLEAAHISPYRGENDNHPGNGLLLRADVHTLFDLGLLAIHPVDLTVRLAPDVIEAGYGELHGKALRCGVGLRPSQDALEKRWHSFAEFLQVDLGAQAGTDGR